METEKLDVAGKKLSLIEAFADLPDPRVVGRSKHDLTERLVVAVCGLVCGVDDFVGIQRQKQRQQQQPKQLPKQKQHRGSAVQLRVKSKVQLKLSALLS